MNSLALPIHVGYLIFTYFMAYCEYIFSLAFILHKVTLFSMLTIDE